MATKSAKKAAPKKSTKKAAPKKSTKKAASKTTTKPAAKKAVVVTGHSMTFSFDEAIRDALEQAHAQRPSPPRNPDVAVSITVTHIEARSGGNIRPGLSVTATVG